MVLWSGQAFSFFIDQEKGKLHDIEDYLKNKNEFLSLSELNTGALFNLVAPMKTMYINGGKKDKVRAGDILGALINEAGLMASMVGNITILEKQSYVAIEAKHLANAISSLSLGKIKGRKFKVGEA